MTASAKATMADQQGVLRGVLEALTGAEADYRKAHDLHGDDARETGRAWDLMRRAGDKARAVLACREVIAGTAAVEEMRQACIEAVRAEQKYEASDFPVCNSIIRAIQAIPAQVQP